ncbi:hypothetical protein ACO0QE_002938 [Hanseniaspora vineae]
MSMNPAFPDYCIFCDQLIQQNRTPTTSLTCATAVASVGLNSKQKTLYCSNECFHRDQMLKSTHNNEGELAEQRREHGLSKCNSHSCNNNSNEKDNYSNLQMLSPISYNGDFINNSPCSNTKDGSDLQDDFFQLDQDHGASHYSAVPSASAASTSYKNSDDNQFHGLCSYSYNTQSHAPSTSLQIKNTPLKSGYISLFDQSHQIFYKKALEPKGNYGQELNDGICENNYKIWLNENHI